MIRESLDTYDVLPESMINYLRFFGRHFNRKLCDFAVNKMTTKGANDKEEKLKIITKPQLDELITKYKIQLKNDILYDATFVANMCKADFYGSSITDEHHLALYVKDVLDDIDGYDGMPFNRWYADTVRKGIPIDWESML